MRAYIIGRGEDLQSIAARLGFDPNEVWNADDNRELRELRNSPQVLAPGDVLYVPDVEQEELMVTAKTTNEYTADIDYLNVGLKLGVGDGEARADEPYEIYGLSETLTGSADGDGCINVEVPAHVRQLYVYFPEQETGARVRLGDLDPASDEEGIRTRLFNLGYLPSDEILGPRMANVQTRDQREADLAMAVRHFQQDAGIEPTGELDDETRAAIRDRHGV